MVSGGKHVHAFALVAVAAAGVLLRLQEALRLDASPDAVGYVYRAARWTFLDPWAADDREPLWVAVTKVVSAPFGYRVGALQVFSFACSVVAMAAVWALLRRVVANDVARLVGFAVVALHPLLAIDAGLGIREPFVVGISAVIASAALDRRWLLAGVLAGVLLGVRWELGLLWVALLALAAIARRPDWRAVVAAGAVATVLMGPFLVANARETGDPMAHSNRHARYYRNIEQGYRDGVDPYSLPRFRGEPISWAGYYVDFVGVDESLSRIAEGSWRVPTRVAGFGHGAAVGVLVLALAVFAVVVRRSRVTVGAVLFFVGGTLGYAALWWVMEYRLVSFLVLPLAVLVASAVDVIAGSVGAERASRVAGAGVVDDDRDRLVPVLLDRHRDGVAVVD